jgi:hypothetical protein
MLPRSTAQCVLSILLFATPVLADWKPPADGKITEDRLKVFLDTQNDWLEELASVVHQAGGGKSGDAKAPTVADVGKLYQACLDRHHIGRAEFEWLGKAAGDAWGAVAYLDGSRKTQQDQLDEQQKELDAQVADAQKRLETYKEAQANGWRVLGDSDRDAIVKLAQSDQQAAADEASQRADEVAARESEAVNDVADAKTAEDEAANPPADVSPDDRTEYVQNKKNEAHAAREAASEARNEEADEKKELADVQAQVDAAAHRATHPEIPVTADEKAQANGDDDAGVAAAAADIQRLQAGKAELAKSEGQLKQTAAKVTGNVPAENIAIMRKYGDEYKAELARAQGGGATTQAGG